MIKEFRLLERGVDAMVSVSHDGTFLSVDGRSRKLVLTKYKRDRRGCYRVSIQKKGFMVSRLVAYAFLGEPEKGQVVLHKDSDTRNNHFENLRYGTMDESWKNSKSNGLKVGKGSSKWSLSKRSGSPFYPSKIGAEDAKKIAKRLDAGEYARDIASEYGVNEMTIRRIRVRYCEVKQVSPRYSREFKERAYKLLRTHTAVEVAKILGVRYETILRWGKGGIYTQPIPGLTFEIPT